MHFCSQGNWDFRSVGENYLILVFMRKSQESIQIFDAVHGKVSKEDLKTIAAAAMQLQHIDNEQTSSVLRNLQTFICCHFIALPPESVEQKQAAIHHIQILHKLANDLEWINNFGLSLIA